MWSQWSVRFGFCRTNSLFVCIVYKYGQEQGLSFAHSFVYYIVTCAAFYEFTFQLPFLLLLPSIHSFRINLVWMRVNILQEISIMWFENTLSILNLYAPHDISANFFFLLWMGFWVKGFHSKPHTLPRSQYRLFFVMPPQFLNNNNDSSILRAYDIWFFKQLCHEIFHIKQFLLFFSSFSCELWFNFVQYYEPSIEWSIRWGCVMLCNSKMKRNFQNEIDFCIIVKSIIFQVKSIWTIIFESIMKNHSKRNTQHTHKYTFWIGLIVWPSN